MPSFFVSHCFHWIGFHIVSHLLENGYSVTGHEHSMTDKKEHLAMMVGRNDMFTMFIGDTPKGKYTHVILPDKNSDVTQDVEAVKTFKLSREERQNDKKMVDVRIPLLFGEWMPMNENGMYANGKYIPFESETFQNKAVYIGDFIMSLMLCLMSSHQPGKLAIQPKSSMSAEKDRKSVFLRERRPVDQQVQTVIAHYKRFKRFYMEE